MVNFDSKDLTMQFVSIYSVTLREVGNTEIGTNEVQPSENLTSSHAQCDYLGKCLAISSQSVQDSCEDYDLVLIIILDMNYLKMNLN